MRKFILALLLFLGVIFILMRMSEVQDIVNTLHHGDWRYVGLAFSVIIAWMVAFTLQYYMIYKAIGLEETFHTLLPVVIASIFVNTVMPTAGMSGMAVFVAEARRRNYSPGRAAIAGALAVLFDYAAFACILFMGMFVLIRRNNLNIGEIIAASILISIAIVLTVLIYLGMRSADALGQALSWLARLVNRVLHPFIKREYLSETRAHEFARDAAEGLREIDREPGRVIVPFVISLVKFGLLITVLFLCFLAFEVPISIGTLVASFSIAYLFLIVSPTPSGLGIVEGALPLALSSMYVPMGAAAIITLAYRGITFWMPLFIGMLAFRYLGGSKDIEVMV